MESLFKNPWPYTGKLHVYALPDDELRDELLGYQTILDGVDYCRPQPRDYLHATVQSYPVFRQQVRGARLDALQDGLAQFTATLAPFTLRFGGPVVHKRAITADAEGIESWEQLVAGIRRAATSTVCTEDDLDKAPFRPHMSLGYAKADGSTAELKQALAALGRPLDRELVVDQVHLLAVDMHPDEGRFDWEPVASYKLGG